MRCFLVGHSPGQPAIHVADENSTVSTNVKLVDETLVFDVESHRICMSGRPVASGLALSAFHRPSELPSNHRLVGVSR